MNNRITLITQYNEKYINQLDFQQCLKQNIENIFIDEIHIFVNKIQLIHFVPEKLKHKVKQILIKNYLLLNYRYHH